MDENQRFQPRTTTKKNNRNLAADRSSPFSTGNTSIIHIHGVIWIQNELFDCHLHLERNSTPCSPCFGADPYETSLQLGAGRGKWLIAPRIFTMDPGHGQDLCWLIAETSVHHNGVSQIQGHLTCQSIRQTQKRCKVPKHSMNGGELPTRRVVTTSSERSHNPWILICN